MIPLFEDDFPFCFGGVLTDPEVGVDLIALGKDPNIIFDGENFMRFQMIPGHQVLGGLKGCCVGTGGKDAYPWVMNKKCNLNTGL